MVWESVNHGGGKSVKKWRINTDTVADSVTLEAHTPTYALIASQTHCERTMIKIAEACCNHHLTDLPFDLVWKRSVYAQSLFHSFEFNSSE